MSGDRPVPALSCHALFTNLNGLGRLG